MRMIGDEPYQMKQKFPDVTIAVDRNRCHGIDLLTESADEKSADVILLDDAFQHRYVKPGINILLVDYHRLIIYDKLMPAGRLREPKDGKARADIVIITKCPADLKPIDYRVITKAMNLFPYQELYFSTIDYCPLVPLFGGEEIKLEEVKDMNVLLLTGIASPKQMQEDLTAMGAKVNTLTYSDHHQFKKKDIVRINEMFAAMPSPKMIITTEKDAARLHDMEGLSQHSVKGYNEAGLLIAHGNTYYQLGAFPLYNCGNMFTVLSPHGRPQFPNSKGYDFDPIMQFERCGDLLFARTSKDGVTWNNMPGSPIEVKAKTLSVGVYQTTYSENYSWATLSDFIIYQ